MSRLKLGSILALIGGPFILGMNYLETSEKEKINREGITAQAEPLTKIVRKGRRGSRHYKLEIEYPLQAGGTQTTQVEVSHELFDRIETMPALEIKYLKERPTKLIVVGEPLSNAEMNYVGIGALVFGAFGTWWYFLRKQPQPESSPTVPAPVPAPTSVPPPLPPGA